MERISVQSSNLASVGYDPQSLTLEVEFRNGSAYQYFGVPEYIYEGLINAGSKGAYFDQNIKRGGYSFSRIA
jgi:hypothetical protein